MAVLRERTEMNLRLLSFFVAALLCSCGWISGGPGTAGYSVTIVNESRDVVIFYAQGVGESTSSAVTVGVRLEPSAGFVDHWLTPNSGSGDKRAIVRATSSVGQLVFCRVLSWSDIRLSDYRIKVTPGVNAC
jgi:hypothetical protein